MRLLYVFSAIVAAVSGYRQSATGSGDPTLINYMPSEFLKPENVANHRFETMEDPDTKQQVCRPDLYIGASLPGTTLNKVNENADGLNQLGPTNCIQQDGFVGYNAMGYQHQTNFVYAVTDHEITADTHHIVRVDRHGCTENVANLGHLGNVDGSWTRHIAGDISDGKTFWVAQGKFFRAVNLAVVENSNPPQLAYWSWEFPVCTRMNDFAFAPPAADGKNLNLAGDAFGWDMKEKAFCRFTPGTDGFEYNPMPELLSNFGVSFPDNAIIGGFFFDHDGAFWIYDNKNDQLYKFTGLDNAVAEFELGNDATITQELSFHVNGADNANNIDGCSCVQSPGKFEPIDPTKDPRCRKRDEL